MEHGLATCDSQHFSSMNFPFFFSHLGSSLLVFGCFVCMSVDDVTDSASSKKVVHGSLHEVCADGIENKWSLMPF